MTERGGAEQAYPSAIRGWIAIAVLFVLYILSFTDRNIIALLVEPMKRDLGMSDFLFSLMTGPAFGVLYSISAIPIGLLVDRFGRRIVLYLSVTSWSLAAAACGLAPNVPLLMAARAVLGAGEAGFSTAAYSVVGDSFPPKRVPLAMSVFAMGGIMGAGLASLLGGLLVSALTAAGDFDAGPLGMLAPWRQVLILTGIPGVALAFLLFLLPSRRSTVESHGGYGEAVKFVWRHGRFYGSVLIGISLYYVVIIGLQIWTPTYLIRTHGWEPGRIGVVLGIAQLCGALTLPLHGWTVQALYRRGMQSAHMTWCMINATLGIGLATAAYLVTDPWVTVVLFGCFIAAGMSAAGIGPALVQMATPMLLRGRISAIYVVTTGLIAICFGPTAVAFITNYIIHDEMKVGQSMILSAVVILPVSILILSLGRHRLSGMIAGHQQEAAAPKSN